MKLNIQKPVVMLVKLVVLFWVQGKALQQHFHGQNINKEKKKIPNFEPEGESLYKRRKLN